MTSEHSTIQVAGLGKIRMAELQKRAKALGMSAERYARQLIEDGLQLEKRAQSENFDNLLAGVRNGFQKSRMTESNLDQLVDEARARHQRRTTTRKKR